MALLKELTAYFEARGQSFHIEKYPLPEVEPLKNQPRAKPFQENNPQENNPQENNPRILALIIELEEKGFVIR